MNIKHYKKIVYKIILHNNISLLIDRLLSRKSSENPLSIDKLNLLLLE